MKNISANLTTGVTTASPQLQSALSGILSNAGLSTADKFRQMANTIKNDPNLSSNDKTRMLSVLARQEKAVGEAP